MFLYVLIFKSVEKFWLNSQTPWVILGKIAKGNLFCSILRRSGCSSSDDLIEVLLLIMTSLCEQLYAQFNKKGENKTKYCRFRCVC